MGKGAAPGAAPTSAAAGQQPQQGGGALISPRPGQAVPAGFPASVPGVSPTQMMSQGGGPAGSHLVTGAVASRPAATKEAIREVIKPEVVEKLAMLLMVVSQEEMERQAKERTTAAQAAAAGEEEEEDSDTAQDGEIDEEAARKKQKTREEKDKAALLSAAEKLYSAQERLVLTEFRDTVHVRFFVSYLLDVLASK